ncbi:peptidase M28 [Ornithinimicrobium sp. CNJ-824]|nr:M20/M25/M40 family metallo-hydrolase [Ornithinimicrobium sp. CNJ-824]OLT23326.1 peptidase M28 [Ornithinimicrobium sp. CNJ-824]
MGAPALAKGQGGENHGNPNTSKKITQAVDLDNVWAHLEEFQRIADENGDNRAAGTDGYEASAAYVESTLEAAGYETERQYFTFEQFSVRQGDLTVEDPPLGAMDNIVMRYSPSGSFTGTLAAPSVATGCDVGDWTGFPAGSIALVGRGACSFAQKTEHAATAGAGAAIIYNNAAGALNGTLGDPGEDYVPVTGISQADGQGLLEAMSDGPVTVTVEIDTVLEEVETFNVLAETPQGRPDNVVMVGAHLDGVDDGPGINDNGSGSAAILETAVQLAEVNKLNNQVRFAWWGAEEHGLLGSWHYVEDLYANDPDSLDDIATYLNFDMVGSPNYVIGVYDADESTYAAPVEVPDGSIETEDVFTDYFDSIGQPWVDTMFSGRSDYQPFIAAGIRSGLFTGADGTKTEEEVEMFGGTAGITYDPNYHTPADDLSNVNPEALDIMSDAIAHATLSLAQDTSEVNGKRSAGKSGKPHPGGPMPVEDAREAA